MAFRDIFFKFSDWLHSKGRDWTALLLSLIIAVVIWLVSSLAGSYSTVMSVSLTAECVIEGHNNLSTNSVSLVAHVRTSGFRTLSSRLRREDKTVTLSIDRNILRQRSEEEFFVTASSLTGYVSAIYGDDVTLEGFVSDTLFFRFPSEHCKKVPVVPASVIRFRPQYMELSPVRTDPDSVMIYGDPKTLSRVSSISTRTIRLDDVHGNTHGMIALDAPGGVRTAVSEVRYSIESQRYVETSSRMKIYFTGVPDGIELKAYPPEVDVTLRCLFPMTYDPTGDLRLVIPYSDFEASRTGRCIPVLEVVPEGLINCSVSPEIIRCVEVAR